jgi:hypothetical protein
MDKIIPVTVAIAVVCVGAGFFGGTQYQKAQTQSGFAKFANGNYGGSGSRPDDANQIRRGQGNSGFVNGDIIAKDDKSVTVQLRDGGSKIIFYSGSTQISQMAATTADALAVGQSVMAQGTVNTDGSVVAQSIQLRPAQAPSKSSDGQVPASEGAQLPPNSGPAQ